MEGRGVEGRYHLPDKLSDPHGFGYDIRSQSNVSSDSSAILDHVTGNTLVRNSAADNKAMEGFWNWYVAYDYEADTGPFHGEAYFKSTADHLYRVDTAADKNGYNNYPFSTIISSFKLK